MELVEYFTKTRVTCTPGSWTYSYHTDLAGFTRSHILLNFKLEAWKYFHQRFLGTKDSLFFLDPLFLDSQSVEIESVSETEVRCSYRVLNNFEVMKKISHVSNKS